MGGHVTLGLGATSSVQAAVRAGRVRALGIGSLTPSATFPDAPVIAKDVPGFEGVIWFGLLAPRGTPREIVERIHSEIVQVLKMPEVRQKMLEAGADPGGESPQEFAARIRAEITRFGKVVQAAGLKP
jgi:tripartite-type tricarboxylate transporter receptor subunit TctC